MLHITMRNMEDNFKVYRGHFNCSICGGIVWFFRNQDAPSNCPYCQEPFVKLYGLLNGFVLAKTRYYKYGDE